MTLLSAAPAGCRPQRRDSPFSTSQKLSCSPHSKLRPHLSASLSDLPEQLLSVLLALRYFYVTQKGMQAMVRKGASGPHTCCPRRGLGAQSRKALYVLTGAPEPETSFIHRPNNGMSSGTKAHIQACCSPELCQSRWMTKDYLIHICTLSTDKSQN